MLVNCMLPVSIVESEWKSDKKGFSEWVEYMDPYVNYSTRHTIKVSGLPSLRKFVDEAN